MSWQNNKDNQVNKHESNNDSFEVEKFRVFIFDGEPVEGLAIEVNSDVDREDQEKDCFYCYFYSIRLIV